MSNVYYLINVTTVMFPYMYVEIFQLYQVVMKQSSSDVIKRLGSFFIWLLKKDKKQKQKSEQTK